MTHAPMQVGLDNAGKVNMYLVFVSRGHLNQLPGN